MLLPYSKSSFVFLRADRVSGTTELTFGTEQHAGV